jgi:S1-C subfamily serine protease
MRGPVYFEGNKDSRLPEIFNRAGFIFDAHGHGLQIMTVLPGTPGALLAGLQTGDVITSVNGETPADDINQPVFSSRLALNSI